MYKKLKKNKDENSVEINKKVRNARKKEYDGIIFDSNLEISCYKLLKENDIPFTYNSSKQLLLDGFNFNKVKFFQPTKETKEFLQNTRKVVNTTYSPDFEIITNSDNLVIFIETKGKENDVYPLKRKMFFNKLENIPKDCDYYFFEPHNIKQIIETIRIIKEIIFNNMTLLNKIIISLQESINDENGIYNKDFHLSMNFINDRNFDDLKDLIDSIIKKEERKEKENRVINLYKIIEAKTFIDEYVEKLK